MHDFMKTIVSALQAWTKKLIKNNTPDWNQNDANAEGYIKNRPFYASTSGSKVLIMSETIVSTDNSESNITEPLVVGNTYTVTFDGADYECVCREYDGYYMLGNNAIYEYDNGIEIDTGEPFAVETEGDGLQLYWYLQNDDEHTASVSQAGEEIIQKIDKKYLPEMSNIGAEGSGTNAEIFNDYSYNKAIGGYSHAEGYMTTAYGNGSHAEGEATIAYGIHSHAEGCGYGISTLLSGDANTTVYNGSFANTNIKPGWVVSIDQNQTDFAVVTDITDSTITLSRTLSNIAITKIIFTFSPAASGGYSHVEGNITTAYGNCAHAEGDRTAASGESSHAEGYFSVASGTYSHAEGQSAQASGPRGSHAEGRNTVASGESSHAEGRGTTASGKYSHAEGYASKASGESSHAEGTATKAAGNKQHVQGGYNIEDTASKYAHIVGNGTSDTARSNAHTLDWDGNGWFAGDVYVGGTGKDDASAKQLATKEYVDGLIDNTKTYVQSVNGVLPDENGDVKSDAAFREDMIVMNGRVIARKTASEISSAILSAKKAPVIACSYMGEDNTMRHIATSMEKRWVDGGYVDVLYFDDKIAPIIVNQAKNTITVDPDWVSPNTTLTANGLVLTDETTGAKYRLFINNGELTTQLLS